MGSLGNMPAIPLVDMTLYTCGSEADKNHFCESLLQAFSNQGMVKVANHSIPHEKIKSAFEWVSLVSSALC